MEPTRITPTDPIVDLDAVPAAMAGLPALAAPAGFGPGGLPAGLQIIGPVQSDATVLQIGHAYDQAGGFSRVRSTWLGKARDAAAPSGLPN